uniref:Abhydrolase_4 domain-containing protein n=1 Tax=Caenorhabditis tropicalis TaxID=1561998 RepID=A0A1I7UE16_9PELO
MARCRTAKYLRLERRENFIYPVLFSNVSNFNTLKIRFWIYLRVNGDEIKCEGIVEKDAYVLRGPGIPIQDVPNKLSIEYGLQGIAWRRMDEPWKMIPYENHYNSQGSEMTVYRGNGHCGFVGNRHHFAFHSPFFASLPPEDDDVVMENDDYDPDSHYDSDDFDDCFNIAHGSTPCLKYKF